MFDNLLLFLLANRDLNYFLTKVLMGILTKKYMFFHLLVEGFSS